VGAHGRTTRALAICIWHALPKRGEQICFSKRRAIPQDDDCGHAFTNIWMRQTDYCRFGNSCKRIDLRLDLPGIDIEAAADHEVRYAACDPQVARRIDRSEVTSDEEPVFAERCCRPIRLAPIALKDVRAAQFDHSDLPGREWRTLVRIGNAQFDSGERKPDRTGDPFSVTGVRRDHAGLRHPVTLENGVTGAIEPRPMGFRQERRRA
jgi:hypothetical protein